MRLYLSHSIRGKEGPKASLDTQNHNCEEAKRIANILRGLFPRLELYVPAENETFVQIAFDRGYITEEQILWVDCAIIDTLDGVIVYVPDGDELQGGRLVEFRHARATNKWCITFSNANQAANWIEAMYRRVQI